MVLPLLKVGRLSLKTISKPFSTRIKKEAYKSNDRITKTMQQRFYGRPTDAETRNLNEVKPGPDDLTAADVIVFLVVVVAVIFGMQRHVKLRMENTESGKLVRQEIEKLKEELRQMEKAKGGGVSEAKISRD